MSLSALLGTLPKYVLAIGLTFGMYSPIGLVITVLQIAVELVVAFIIIAGACALGLALAYGLLWILRYPLSSDRWLPAKAALSTSAATTWIVVPWLGCTVAALHWTFNLVRVAWLREQRDVRLVIAFGLPPLLGMLAINYAQTSGWSIRQVVASALFDAPAESDSQAFLLSQYLLMYRNAHAGGEPPDPLALLQPPVRCPPGIFFSSPEAELEFLREVGLHSAVDLIEFSDADRLTIRAKLRSLQGEDTIVWQLGNLLLICSDVIQGERVPTQWKAILVTRSGNYSGPETYTVIQEDGNILPLGQFELEQELRIENERRMMHGLAPLPDLYPLLGTDEKN